MHKVYIDDDTADSITVCSLRESIRVLKNSIAQLESIKRPSKVDKQDLEDCRKSLAALEIAFDYYGGNAE